MPRKSKDLHNEDGRFGPYQPMRGAHKQALAVQQKNADPISPSEKSLKPPKYEMNRREGYRKMRDWD